MYIPQRCVVTLVVYTRKAKPYSSTQADLEHKAMCDVALSRLGSVAANQWYSVSLGGRRSLSPGGTFHMWSLSGHDRNIPRRLLIPGYCWQSVLTQAVHLAVHVC